MTFYSPATAKILLKVLNSSGDIIINDSVIATKGDQNIVDVNVQDLILGTYQLKLSDEVSESECSFFKKDPPRKLEIISCAPKEVINDFQMQFYSPLTGMLALDVFDEFGALVVEKQVVANHGDQNIVDVKLTGLKAGSYTIRLSDGISQPTCIVAKIDPPKQLEILSCLPNPTDGPLSVTFNSLQAGSVVVTITNSQEFSVFSKTYSANVGENIVNDINIGESPAGDYTVSVDNGSDFDSWSFVRRDVLPVQPLRIDAHTESTVDIVVVKFFSPLGGEVIVSIFDKFSNELDNYTFSSVKGDNTLSIDLSEFTPGTYQIMLSNSSSYDACEVVREKNPLPFRIISCKPKTTISYCRIHYISPFDQNIIIKVFDKSGKVVFEEDDTANVGENRVFIDMSDFVEGVYSIALSDGNKTLYEEVFVENLPNW